MQEENKGLRRVEETRKRAGELEAKFKKQEYEKYEVSSDDVETESEPGLAAYPREPLHASRIIRSGAHAR